MWSRLEVVEGMVAGKKKNRKETLYRENMVQWHELYVKDVTMCQRCVNLETLTSWLLRCFDGHVHVHGGFQLELLDRPEPSGLHVTSGEGFCI